MPDPSPSQIDRATVFIHLDAIRANAQTAQSLAPNTQLLAMVKANAYGHGMLEVADALDGIANMLGVARLNEAQALRNAGCGLPVLLFSELLTVERLVLLKQLKLTPVIYSGNNAKTLVAACEDLALPYWIKLDSGMHRLGLNQALLPILEDARHCQAIATHFHSADLDDLDSAARQLNHYQQALEGLPAHLLSSLSFSISNSAALLNHSNQSSYTEWLNKSFDSHRFAGQIIRPGIMLYGSNPLTGQPSRANLQPTMTFKAPIIDIRRVRAGDSVGYGQRWRANADAVIATVAAGYGDGYPRHAVNGTPVGVAGQTARLAGTVSMDMIGVDISELLSRGVDINIGDSAELWGPQIPIDRIAKNADTISYELMTSITARVRREYRTN